MPYKTKYGTHYHMSPTCRAIAGKDVMPCSMAGLDPCEICCQQGAGGGGDATGASTGGVGAAATPSAATFGDTGTPDAASAASAAPDAEAPAANALHDGMAATDEGVQALAGSQMPEEEPLWGTFTGKPEELREKLLKLAEIPPAPEFGKMLASPSEIIAQLRDLRAAAKQEFDERRAKWEPLHQRIEDAEDELFEKLEPEHFTHPETGKQVYAVPEQKFVKHMDQLMAGHPQLSAKIMAGYDGTRRMGASPAEIEPVAREIAEYLQMQGYAPHASWLQTIYDRQTANAPDVSVGRLVPNTLRHHYEKVMSKAFDELRRLDEERLSTKR